MAIKINPIAMKKIFALPFFLLLSLLLFTTCKKKPSDGTVNLIFEHQVGSQKLVLNEYLYTCEAGYEYSVIRLKYYVSNFVLTRDDGEEYILDAVHYRELGVDNTRMLEMFDVPPGTYTSLSFIYGLDEDTNVPGGLENTVTNINMEWPLVPPGYHYMKLEGKYKMPGTGEIKAYNTHTGATGGNQNYINITLPLNNLEVSDNSWDITLVMDLEEWYQNPSTYDFEEFGSMIMDNQDAQAVLKANGADIFHVESMEVN